MARKTTISREGLEFLIGAVKNTINIGDIINNEDLADNKTYSNIKIEERIDDKIDEKLVKYDDTEVKSDIVSLKEYKQNKTDNTLDTTDKTITGAINEVNGNLLDTVGFSADYKNIILNRKNGLNPYTIPISTIINNSSLAELKDVDSTDVGDGKILVYDGITNKHKYVDSSITDELVKMDNTTDANYLSDLIDKSTVVNDNGVLKVKKLDGQEVTITEINYLKGLTMNIMDLVNVFSNGGIKVLNTPLNTASELDTMDRTSFIDGISYIVYVLADENHSGAKTTYLLDKTSTTFFGNADSQRDFTTNPIDLANEVTGKLDNSHIDIDSLWTLLTINDTYKTLTTNNEIFGTHGAKAMYDELATAIGKKANTSDIPTKVSELTNDSNYQTAKQVNSAVTTEIAKVETELKGNIKEINDSLVDKADVSELAGLKRRYNSIEELNTIKKKSLVLVNGEDNTQKVLDALDAGEVLSDYFSNTGSTSRFGINDSLGTCFIITFEKNDSGYAKIIANSATSNTVLVRYHSVNKLSAWQELATMDKVPKNIRKVFGDINELNNAKGTNISLVVGEDNTEKIISVLEPYEEFINWFGNTTATDRFGIDKSMGTRLNVISIQRFTKNEGLAYAITNEGNVFSRFFQDGVLSEWDYDSTNLTEMNTKISQLESKATTNEADITDINTKTSQLETQVSDLFQSVSDGKTLVANAITDKGISTSTTATFATMASNISKINGYKEETKSYNNTSSGATRLVFTFSADVSGVKQITPPSDATSYIAPETLTSLFTVNGKKLTLYVNGVGTWKVTAIVKQ